jgi:hypothetical protein
MKENAKVPFRTGPCRGELEAMIRSVARSFPFAFALGRSPSVRPDGEGALERGSGFTSLAFSALVRVA